MKKKTGFEQIYDPRFLKGGVVEKGAKENDWHKDWKEEKVFMFTWEYCGQCRKMFVRCPMCGNNCCNAGFGEVTKKDYKPVCVGNKSKTTTCPVCNLAYAYQDLSYATKSVPPLPSKKEMKRIEKENESWIEKVFG